MRNLYLVLLILSGCGNYDYVSPAEEFYRCMAEKVAEFGDQDWIEEDCRFYSNYYMEEL